MSAGLGKPVANKILKDSRGTNWSSYIQLYVAFFLSGLLHFASDFMFKRQLVYYSFGFFLQAVTITFEDFIVNITKRLLHHREVELKSEKADESSTAAVVRVIGYCWVALWFRWVLPVRTDETNVARLNTVDRGPITRFLLDKVALIHFRPMTQLPRVFAFTSVAFNFRVQEGPTSMENVLAHRNWVSNKQ